MIKKSPPSLQTMNHLPKNANLAESVKKANRSQPPGMKDSPSAHRLPKSKAQISRQISSHSHQLSNSNASRLYNQNESFFRSERGAQLHQRLKNLHIFYKNKIEEEKGQTVQRNNVFLGIIEEMQQNHQAKVIELKKQIQNAQNDRRDVGVVDNRMIQIKGSIEEILKESTELKSANQQLQGQINQKEHVLREKEQQLSKLKEQLIEARDQLEGFERLNLKEKKRNKEIVSLIDKSAMNGNHE